MSGLLSKKSRDGSINLLNKVNPKQFKVNTPNITPKSVSVKSVPILPTIPEPTDLNEVLLDDDALEELYEDDDGPFEDGGYSPPPGPLPRQYAMEEEEDGDSISSYCGSDLTPEEETKKKKTLLYKLKRFQKKGFGLSRVYNMESDLVDLKAEVESIKREANLGATVTTMKKGLTITTYLIEMLNTQFDPINAKLEGWSNQVKDDVENGDYDEVFEELYDKYTDRLHMPPEMRLLSMLGTSALQYHIAQVVVNRTLDQNRTDQILRSNPQIKKDILEAVKNNKNARAAAQQAANATHETTYTETQTEQKNMNDPSDIDGILKELEIEDETSKIISTNF